MVSYVIVIIIVGVFFAGIGIGYAALLSNTSTVQMIMTPQQMQQIMSDPDQMFQWHHAMMNDPQVMNDWMDSILNEPDLRQQMNDKMSKGSDELQESMKLTQPEKQDLRAMLLKQMEVHNQNLASLAPFYTDDTNLNEMMTEKMIEHNQLMNQLLNQKTIESDLDESVKKHIEEHLELAKQISTSRENG